VAKRLNNIGVTRKQNTFLEPFGGTPVAISPEFFV